MPNGGIHCCSHCDNFIDGHYCPLRQLEIEIPHWTTCSNWDDTENKIVNGPLHAIVCEVIDGVGSYIDIPYYKGIRVETKQVGKADTTIKFICENKSYEFNSVDDYLTFYESEQK